MDEGNEHVFSVWDWQKGEKGQRIAETKVLPLEVCVAEHESTLYDCIKIFNSACKSAALIF